MQEQRRHFPRRSQVMISLRSGRRGGQARRRRECHPPVRLFRQGRRIRGRASPCTILQTAEVGWFGWITGALLPPDAGIVEGWPVVAAARPIPTKRRTQPLNGLAVAEPAHRYQHSLAATGSTHRSHHCARHPCRIWQKTGPKHCDPRCAGRSDPSSAASSTQFPER